MTFVDYKVASQRSVLCAFDVCTLGNLLVGLVVALTLCMCVLEGGHFGEKEDLKIIT